MNLRVTERVDTIQKINNGSQITVRRLDYRIRQSGFESRSNTL